MALISCPECGKEISDKAKCCPNCGYPISEYKDKPIEPEKEIEDCEIQRLEEILKVIPNNDKLRIIKILSEDAGIGLKHSKKVVDYYFKNADFNVCPKCGARNNKDKVFCEKCAYRIIAPNNFENSTKLNESKKEDVEEVKKEVFHGIYKYTLFGGRKEVYCPRCGSENCEYFQQEKIIPGKTKTRYTANLNPLHPFTLVNKKQKVVREDQIVTKSRIQCNKCGYIFD